MVNCAHPTHFLSVLDEPGPGIASSGIRANASTKSHAELDESEVLDDGDPVELARRATSRSASGCPHLTVLGGCCGTDHRHVASIADAWFGRVRPFEALYHAASSSGDFGFDLRDQLGRRDSSRATLPDDLEEDAA